MRLLSAGRAATQKMRLLLAARMALQNSMFLLPLVNIPALSLPIGLVAVAVELYVGNVVGRRIR
jgi:hypothetical protein